MDDPVTIVVTLFAILAAIGFIGYGVAWVVVNAWPYLILAGLLMGAGLIWYFRHRSVPRKDTETVRVVQQEVRELAQRATTTLAQSRAVVEQEARELGRMRAEARRDLGFKVFADRHFASLRIADSWYRHKRSAMTTRKRVAKGLDTLRAAKGHLTQLHGARGSARTSAVEELRATQSAIDSVSLALSALSREISRGEAAVTRHNQETAQLRDYIRDNFGAGGRAWYANLQARKQARRGA